MITACPKDSLVNGSVGAVARGPKDKDFIESEKVNAGFMA